MSEHDADVRNAIFAERERAAALVESIFAGIDDAIRVGAPVSAYARSAVERIREGWTLEESRRGERRDGVDPGPAFLRGAPRVHIEDHCPSCGSRSLFLGSGGHLTCAVLECASPGVSETVTTIRAERDRAVGVLNEMLAAARHAQLVGLLPWMLRVELLDQATRAAVVSSFGRRRR